MRVWEDAEERYGVFMTFGAYAALISPAPAKQYVSNESRTQDGKEYIGSMHFDERNITLPMGIKANSRSDFFEKFTDFVENVLTRQNIEMKTMYNDDIYRLRYKSISTLTEFNGKLGTFALQLIEPDPTNRA